MYKSKDLIDKALSYVGYLEKASNDDLDDFTANAGNANYTRFCRDYEKYTEAEAHEKGINDSITHVDFMIGTKDLCITATTLDGKTVEIFKDGEWAF